MQIWTDSSDPVPHTKSPVGRRPCGPIPRDLCHSQAADGQMIAVELRRVSAQAGNVGMNAQERVQNGNWVGVSQAICVERVAPAAVF